MTVLPHDHNEEENTLPAIAGTRQLRGYENVRPDDLVIPRVRIVQPQSDFPGSPPIGYLYNTQTMQSFESISCVPMAMIHSRVYWENLEDETPRCGSNNGRTPRRDNPNGPISLECASCPMGKWNNGEPPRCSDRFTFVFVDMETGARFMTDFYRSSYKIGRAIVSAYRNSNIEFWERPMVLFTTKGKRYQYYEYAFIQEKYENRAMAPIFKDMFEEFQSPGTLDRIMNADLGEKEEQQSESIADTDEW